MRFTLQMECDNAAFGAPNSSEQLAEIAHILMALVVSLAGVRHGFPTGVLRDSNGNTVGTWSLGE